MTLKDDVEMEFSADACKYTGLNAGGLKPHFQTLGFTNLLSCIGADGEAAGAAAAPAGRSMRVSSPMAFEDGLFGPMGGGGAARAPAPARPRWRRAGDYPGPATGVVQVRPRPDRRSSTRSWRNSNVRSGSRSTPRPTTSAR